MTHRGFNAVMESFFSSVKSEEGERFDSFGRSLTKDRQVNAKTKSVKGQGDRGDR